MYPILRPCWIPVVMVGSYEQNSVTIERSVTMHFLLGAERKMKMNVYQGKKGVRCEG